MSVDTDGLLELLDSLSPGFRRSYTTGRVLEEVGAERRRQFDKWGEQNCPDFDLADDAVALPHADDVKAWVARAAAERRLTWAHIVLEEVAEAIDEAAYNADGQDTGAELRAELVQVAAVAVAWVEAIDRRKASR